MVVVVLVVLSCVWLFVTLWTVACQVPLSLKFFWQEILEWVAISTPGDLPNSGIEPMSLASPVLAGRFFTTVTPEKPMLFYKWGNWISERLSAKPVQVILCTTANFLFYYISFWEREKDNKSEINNGTSHSYSTLEISLAHCVLYMYYSVF